MSKHFFNFYYLKYFFCVKGRGGIFGEGKGAQKPKVVKKIIFISKNV